MKRKVAIFIILSLFVPWDTGRANSVSDAGRLTDIATQEIIKELETIRLNEKDVKLSAGWPLNFTVKDVESLFSRPFTLGKKSTEWADRVEESKTTSDLYHVAATLLKSTPTAKLSVTPKKLPAFPSQFPKQLRPLLTLFYRSLENAQAQLNRGVDTVPFDDREEYLTLYAWPKRGTNVVVQEISSRRIERKFNGMKPYQQSDTIEAGARVFAAIDALLPELKKMDVSLSKPVKWKTPLGTFLIAGDDTDTYNDGDLDDVVLLIDFGGANQYNTSVAAALDKEIRIAIDFGTDITIQTPNESKPNAGAGVFGIGVLVLPNKDGVKRIDINSYGQGCGLGGVGALFIEGKAHLTGASYVQGTGVFGIGLLHTSDGHQSTYSAERNGQGLGLTRGVGIFHHVGNESDIQGGLIQPDPREPQGSVSLCQGVGFGRRAYTGGGIGMAVIEGDRSSVMGSYFAQGVGYWHALGLFRYRGNESRLQARRYAFGSGVHSAFGHFQLFGNKNNVINWGAGPVNGWDNSVGSAFIEGSDNIIQAKWGTGTAQVNSLAYSYISGDRNKLKLRSYGSGAYYRRRHAYSAHILDGKENKLIINHGNLKEEGPVRIMYNPWGVFRLESPILDKFMTFPEPQWPQLKQEKMRTREQLDLRAHVKAAETKASPDKVSDLIDVASAFSLDKDTPKDAFRRLLSLPPESVPDLVNVFTPLATDQMIYLWPILAAYGDPITNVILDRLDDFSLHKQATLINQLSYHRPSLILKKLFDLLEQDKSSLRIAGLNTLGQILNLDSGQEPGRRAVMVAMRSLLQSPKSKKEKNKLIDLVSRIRPPEAYGLISCAVPTTKESRLAFYAALGDDITDAIQKKGAEKFVDLLLEDQEGAKERLTTALNDLSEAEDKLRVELARLLKSRKTSEVKAALLNLSRIANPEDLPLIQPFIKHSSGTVREAVAVGLGRMGAAAIPFMKETMKSGTVLERKTIMAAAPHSVTRKIVSIIRMGVVDSDPGVQLTACSVIFNSSPIIDPSKKKLMDLVNKKFKKSKNASLRVAGPIF